ncbi:hypothetical protein O6H91_10G045600 [Diphasiastrum complanatum]|uniref:Uncharacterized protein n=3 Tax=Diphasiastrum complanatum TaxID=34168 RepID=A0ACC2CGH1_DIPCM|nr:hypothetical protein O6H91_10G045600 [Diphasiastrum complanatum]KAJ7541092.1 hypothetical protein O6H91_10G045600 [Diphasiastrum complanatum]KAJ7541093.1 hypothetical protein O6H91_10G045600 [Diphasiastrum complanatum]
MEVASKVRLGGKGTLLSAQAVYDVAYHSAFVEIEFSNLDRLKQGSAKESVLLPAPTPTDKRHSMSETEERATLVVLLNKLLQSQARIRPFLPTFVAEILNLRISINLPSSTSDLEVSLEFVRAVYRFQKLFESSTYGEDFCEVGTCAIENSSVEGAVNDEVKTGGAINALKEKLSRLNAEDFGVTKDELEFLKLSDAASVGIAVLFSYPSSSLSVLSDVVAALSCEALQTSTQAFDSDTFNQPSTHKAEADVANDMKSLLMGSKSVNARKGGVSGDFIFSIPSVHGAFREASKVTVGRLRIDINRVGLPVTVSPLLLQSVVTLTLAFFPLISNSWRRATQTLKMIQDLHCPEIGTACSKMPFEHSEEELDKKKKVLSALSEIVLSENMDGGVSLFQEAFCLAKITRKALAMEAAAALSFLGLRDMLMHKQSARVITGLIPNDKQAKEVGSPATDDHGDSKISQRDKVPKGKEGTDRKKKGPQEIVLGKGTTAARQFLLQLLQDRCDLEKGVTEDARLCCWAKELHSFFEAKDADFQVLLDHLKAVVESNETRRLPKIAKGTRDFDPKQMAIREKAFGIIVAVFKRHGAVALDTPVFELRETLMGKYGEDSKLIYDLADQGGEILSLRYDLTVPFARYLAMHNLSNMKRYHIARVYRRDNPAKGRYREFYQCDFDIAGQYPLMVADFEAIKVLTELLNELDIGDYEIKLNHRKLLDGMLEICGVPENKFRTICSSIDKLDKLSWEQVHEEMVKEKGLTAEVADKIGTLVKNKGSPLELLAKLMQKDGPLCQNAGSLSALEELGVLFKYLGAARCLQHVIFDLSLARGLDYYTGVIYEAVFKGSTQVGSIAAGGRYDKLVGMFSGKQVPAVGVSLGIERVFTIMEQLEQERNKVVRSTQTEVFVVVLGESLTEVAIQLVSELWAASLKAEFVTSSARKIIKHITYALDAGIPWMVIVGEDELEKGIVQLRNLDASCQEAIARNSLVEELVRRVRVSGSTNLYTVC